MFLHLFFFCEILVRWRCLEIRYQFVNETAWFDGNYVAQFKNQNILVASISYFIIYLVSFFHALSFFESKIFVKNETNINISIEGVKVCHMQLYRSFKQTGFDNRIGINYDCINI